MTLEQIKAEVIEMKGDWLAYVDAPTPADATFEVWVRSEKIQ